MLVVWPIMLWGCWYLRDWLTVLKVFAGRYQKMENHYVNIRFHLSFASHETLPAFVCTKNSSEVQFHNNVLHLTSLISFQQSSLASSARKTSCCPINPWDSWPKLCLQLGVLIGSRNPAITTYLGKANPRWITHLEKNTCQHVKSRHACRICLHQGLYSSYTAYQLYGAMYP